MYISGDSISIQEIYSIAMTCICRIWSVHTVYRHRSSQRCSWVSCVSTRGPRAWMHGSLAAARRRSLPLTIAAARRTLARLARRSLPLAAARCALTTAARSLRAAAQSLRARCCRSLAAARRPLARRSLPLAAPSPLPLARCGARSVHAWAERKPTLTARSGWRSRGCVCSCALRAHVG